MYQSCLVNLIKEMITRINKTIYFSDGDGFKPIQKQKQKKLLTHVTIEKILVLIQNGT